MSFSIDQVVPAPRGGARPSLVAESLARQRLGAGQVLFFTAAAAAPMTVVAGATTTGYSVTGVTGIPAAFVLVGAVLVVFCVGFAAMSRRVANAGALYAYLTAGLGRPAGVGGALLALAGYNALQISLYGGLGVTATGFFADECGWHAAWWVYALGGWAVVAVLGLLKVDLNSRVLAGLLVAEVAVVVLFDAVDLTHPAGGGLTFTTLSPTNLLHAGIGAGMVLAVTAYIGFEAAVVFSEEVRDPRRTVPTAIYLTVGLSVLLYAGSAWAMSVAAGPDRIVGLAREQQTETIFTLVAGHLAADVVTTARVLFLTSMLAAAISFHNMVSRYTFSLGREHVLPAWFGRVSQRTAAPLAGSLTQSALGLAVVVLTIATGADPLTKLFFWGGMWGGAAILVLLTATSAAVVGYFARHRADAAAETVWRCTIAPALAAVALAAVLVTAVANFATLLGVTGDDPLRWQLPALCPLIVAVGVGWALWLRARHPLAYAGIGLGPDAATHRATHTVTASAGAAHAADRTGAVQ